MITDNDILRELVDSLERIAASVERIEGHQKRQNQLMEDYGEVIGRRVEDLASGAGTSNVATQLKHMNKLLDRLHASQK